jgi:hypothetical protein
VVIGGVWALYRFLSLQEIAKARAELEEKRKILTEQGILSVEISTESYPRPKDDGYFIHIRASITNVGNRVETLYWKNSGAYAAPVNQDVAGKVVCGEWIIVKLIGILGEQIEASIAPSEKIIVPFLIPIKKPGVYFLGIRIPRSQRAIEDEKKYLTDILPGDISSWGADTFIKVD